MYEGLSCSGATFSRERRCQEYALDNHSYGTDAGHKWAGISSPGVLIDKLWVGRRKVESDQIPGFEISLFNLSTANDIGF